MKILVLVLVCLSGKLIAQQQAKELVDTGYENYQKGNYEEAVNYFLKAAEIDSEDPEIYYLAGVCKSQLMQNEAAIDFYEKALALDPDYAEVHYEKGYSYFLMNEYEKAIASFDKAVESKPDYAEAYVNRGSVKCITGDKEGALGDWKKAEALGATVPVQECE